MNVIADTQQKKKANGGKSLITLMLLKIGLTATPAAHTVAYFGEPVFRYGIEEASQRGLFVDYDGIAIHSGVKVKGIFLKEGETNRTDRP